MGVYSRFKKNPEGFRALVELLESTPASRRQRMIDVGMEEDPAYTQKAMEFMLNFEDIKNLPDMELAEVLATAQPRTVAYAIKPFEDALKTRFLKNCKPQLAAQIKDFLVMDIAPRDIGGAQLKMIEVARQCEKAGFLKTKRIPL